MASVVDICNLALSHVGNDNMIASISPPDGSREAGYCARFYPLARKELLEPGGWSFAISRQLLAEVTNESTTWTYAYALPADCIRPLRVLPLQLLEDSAWLNVTDYNDLRWLQASLPDERGSSEYEIQKGVIFTNEPEAVLIYISDVTDTSRFTPAFTAALGYLLASYIAGPMIRGSEGVKASVDLRGAAYQTAERAASLDGSSKHETSPHIPLHIRNR